MVIEFNAQSIETLISYVSMDKLSFFNIFYTPKTTLNIVVFELFEDQNDIDQTCLRVQNDLSMKEKKATVLKTLNDILLNLRNGISYKYCLYSCSVSKEYLSEISYSISNQVENTKSESSLKDLLQTAITCDPVFQYGILRVKTYVENGKKPRNVSVKVSDVIQELLKLL